MKLLKNIIFAIAYICIGIFVTAINLFIAGFFEMIFDDFLILQYIIGISAIVYTVYDVYTTITDIHKKYYNKL